MTSSIIASYAILKVNWEQPERKDYLDNFVLIAAEAVRQLPNDIVTLSDVQKQIRASFSFEIPQNTIGSLLSRVKKYGYITQERGVFTRNNKELAKLNFRGIQQRVLYAHETLLQSLIQFALEKYSLTWSVEQAEKILEKYLEENDVRLLSEFAAPNHTSQSNEGVDAKQQSQYVVAKFIEHIRDTQSPTFDHLETIVKGNLLANAIFLSDPSTYGRKFKNTTIYLDTPLAIFALGYAGKPRKTPVLELVNLLKVNGAHIAIFRHSLEELIGILSACAERIRHKQFRYSYGPSIEYFIEKGYSEVEVMMFIENLEADLNRLGIAVVDKPTYAIHKLVINEEEYLKYLQEKINYSKERPLERDKDSVTSIIRLRAGEVYVPIEECVAIFITSNRDLAYSTRRYSEFNYQFGTAPLAITDYEMTNLVWLKNPAAASSLPRRRLMADSFAAVQPSDTLWPKYLSSIDHLEKQSRITSDQYFILRHSIQAKSELMEKTLGDEKVLTEATIEEILEIVQQSIRAEDVARANAAELAKKEAIEKYEAERDARIKIEEDIKAKEEERSIKVRTRAEKISKIAMAGVTVLLMLIFGYLSYLISPLGPLNIDPKNNLPLYLKIIAFGVFWLLLILQTFNAVIGFMPKTFIDKYEKKLAVYIESLIRID